MKISVIGGGVTGAATAAAFRGHVDEVRVYDVDPARRTHDGDAVLDCDVIFVCIPETEVNRQFSYFAFEHKHRNYVLRSTVPVGTTRRLAERYGLMNLVHSPEFLTERTALEDAANPRVMVIGLPQLPRWSVSFGIDGRRVIDCDHDGLATVHGLYANRFPNVPIRMMPSDNSELVKLATNAFFATKVSFWNEIESYCRATGTDFETVRAACVAEGRVGDLHTHVPGPDGKRGFGGKCLPKDLKQLVRCFTDAGVAAPVMTAVQARNNRIDRPEGE